MIKINKKYYLIMIFIISILIVFKIPGNITPSSDNAVRLPPYSLAEENVELHFIVTAKASTLEALSMAQGSLFKMFEMVHGAILVTHGEDSFLFDTGLGRHIDSQFAEDMPFWLKPVMAYEKTQAAVDQIEKNTQLSQPTRIFLSHGHWDHVSGVVDFSDAEIWLVKSELDFIKSNGPPAIFPSQVGSSSIKWHQYALNDKPYAGFSKSYDIYADGSAVIVSLSGHSPGSVGLFVNTSDGMRRFFVGDAVWNLKAIQLLRSKFWIPSKIVDHDQAATALAIAKIKALMDANPDLKVIPAHDLSAWH